MKYLHKMKKYIQRLLAFLIPFVIMAGVGASKGWAPFGEQSIVISDMYQQYISYFSYFRNVLLETDSLLFSFNIGIGDGTIGLLAYYLLSPFNLIILFFAEEMLPTGLFFLMLLKIGSAGLTMHYFLNKTNQSKWYSLVFSTGYALMGYTAAYYFTPMWFDSVILLPIVILGLHRMMVDEKKCSLYTGALFLCIVTNYYTGWMVCLFVSLYFCYLLVCMKKNTIKEYVKTISAFAGFSVLAAGLSMFLLLPTFYAMKESTKSIGRPEFSWITNYEFFQIFKRLLNTAPIDRDFGMPNIFCGTVIIVLVILYFFQKNIKLKEKIAGLFLLIFICTSFCLVFINLLWHGGSSPICFPYRYSFVMSFMLLQLGYRSLLTIEQLLKKKQVICQIIIVGIFVVQIIDVTYYLGKNVAAGASNSQFVSYVEAVREVVKQVQEKDTGFYRMEKINPRSQNDAMLFGYNGISHYSSSASDKSWDFIEKMGFRRNCNWVGYFDGSTMWADSLLGIKYIITDSDTEMTKPYEMVASRAGTRVYENPYALPIGFASRRETAELDVFSKPNWDYFDVQNQIAQTMTSNDAAIYTKADWTIRTVNLAQEDIEDGLIFYKVDNSTEAYIDFTIEIAEKKQLYAYFAAPVLQNAELFVNGKTLGPYFDVFRWNMVSLGEFNAGEKVDCRLVLKDKELRLFKETFYYENLEGIKQWHEALSSSGCEIKKINSAHLEAAIDVAEDYEEIVFTIPFSEGWLVELDGKQVSTREVWGTFLGIDVVSGKHEIVLRYVPYGLIIGTGVSVLCLIILIGLYLRTKKSYDR